MKLLSYAALATGLLASSVAAYLPQPITPTGGLALARAHGGRGARATTATPICPCDEFKKLPAGWPAMPVTVFRDIAHVLVDTLGLPVAVIEVTFLF